MDTTVSAPDRRRSTATPGQRLGYALVGLLALGGSIVAAVRGDGLSVAAMVTFLVAPDLPLLLGMGPAGPPERGRLHPRAVPYYNATHGLVGPLVTLTVAVAGLVVAGSGWPVTVLAAGLAWLAHVTIDRSLGYGLRTRDGWQRG